MFLWVHCQQYEHLITVDLALDRPLLLYGVHIAGSGDLIILEFD